MGTNYYTFIDKCPKPCKHCSLEREVHLGKSSAGWRFTFQYNGGKYYKDIPSMKRWLKGKVIKDEYGQTVTQEWFWAFVNDKQQSVDPSDDPEGIDIGGYKFLDCEFS